VTAIIEELGEAPDRRTAGLTRRSAWADRARDHQRLMQQVWGTDAPTPEGLPIPGRRGPGQPDPYAPIYGGAFGPWPYTAVTPSLDFRSKAQLDPLATVQSNPVLFAPVFKTAFRLASIPIKVYRFTEAAPSGRRRREEAPDHPAYKLLRRPNRYMTRNRVIGGTVVGMFTAKGVGWIKRRSGGPGSATPPIALYPVPAGMLWPIRGSDVPVDHYELRGLPGFPGTPIPETDVCWFTLLADPKDWASSWGPMTSLAGAADTSKGALDALDEIFDSGLLQKLWINMNGSPLTAEAEGRISAQMGAAIARRFGIPIFGEDGETLENAGDPIDIGGTMIRTVEEVRTLVRDVFGVPEQDDNGQAFWQMLGLPLADSIEQELERSLFEEWPRDEAFPQFAMRELLLGTPIQRAEYHRTRILSGQEMPAEARDQEDEAFVEGSELLLVPLNMVPLTTQEMRPPGSVGPQVPPGSDVTENPNAPAQGADQGGSPPGGTPTKGSTNGLGGSEGKDTMATTRARFRAAAREGYGVQRARTVRAYSGQLQRRLRGSAKDATDRIRALLVPEAQRARNRNASRMPDNARAATAPDLPTRAAVLAALEDSGTEISGIVAGFMGQAGSDAFLAAQDWIIGIEEEARVELEGRLDAVFANRAQAVADRFVEFYAEQVASVVQDALAESMTIREVDTAIVDRLGSLADHLVDGIGRSETAWAYEQAAMTSWRQAGIGQLDLVQGGGPCTTGVCDDAEAGSPYDMGASPGDVGFSFEGTDAPPLHPNCECFMVPTETVAGE
jgi:hypothetical protein